jgi:hypothetical protein
LTRSFGEEPPEAISVQKEPQQSARLLSPTLPRYRRGADYPFPSE